MLGTWHANHPEKLQVTYIKYITTNTAEVILARFKRLLAPYGQKAALATCHRKPHAVSPCGVAELRTRFDQKR
jgi:hypothetical protein